VVSVGKPFFHQNSFLLGEKFSQNQPTAFYWGLFLFWTPVDSKTRPVKQPPELPF
jgi:hypothetical protein